MYGARTSMRYYFHSRQVVLLGGLLLSTLIPIVAKADGIVVLVDENGRKIYVNANESSTDVDWMTRSFRSNSSAVSGGIPANIDQLVDQTANRYQVDPKLVHAIIRVESDYDPKAVSSKGAMGLMQLIPATAQRFGVANPFDPKQNLDGGVNYLKRLLGLFQGDLNLSLAAYNAGEHSVQRDGGIPAIPETQKYVRKVTEIYQPGNTAMGKAPISAKTVSPKPPTSPIVRYVDERGVVHYTNVE
jgi:soluble lytic murein transglycosylase-like protein